MMIVLLLVCLVSLPAVVWPAPAVNYDFEDGRMGGTAKSMQVPPKIITENGNKFMRITGSAGDKHAIPSSYPNRTRSQVTFASAASLTRSNMRQTYSFDMRFGHLKATNGVMVFQLFQYGSKGESYGVRNGTGPVVSMYRKGGTVWGRASYANETKFNTFDLGMVRSGQWHNYKVVAVWSHNPSEGRIEIYFDGVRKMTVTGRDSNLGPDSNRIPKLELGLYGDHAVGILDVDNVRVGPSGGAGTEPSPGPPMPPGPPPPPLAAKPLPPPREFRMVTK